MAAFEYNDNIDYFIRQLRRAGVSIQEAAARTLNLGAEWIKLKYTANLKNTFRIRAPRYTLGAVAIMKAHGTRSGGKVLRPLRGPNAINARVGIRDPKGRTHFLVKQELGGVVTGMPKTGGRVPVPLVGARTGGNISKPVAPQFRINESNIVGMDNLRGITNPRRMYGAMRSRAQRGQIDPKKTYQNAFGIFRILKARIKMLRNVENTKIFIKAHPLFSQAVDTLTQSKMAQIFIVAAKGLIGRDK